MKYLILLISPFALMSDLPQEPNQKNWFFYSSCGGYYAGPDVKGGDIGVGYRNVYGTTAVDINVGGTLIDPLVPFAQGSFLIYPMKWSGPYLGAGVSCVPLNLMDDLPLIINLPLIVGYQTSNRDHPKFFQIQFSPLMIPGFTLSAGYGF